MKSRNRLWIGILACALLAAAPVRADAPPLVNDLAAVAAAAYQQRVPVLVAFTTRSCPYCIKARRDYWKPMNERADWRAAVRMVEVMLDGEQTFRDFNGNPTTVREFARRFGVRGVPTVMVFDTSGNPVAEPIVGLPSADFYGAYLKNAVARGLEVMRGTQ
jgi:thioredoxin-related protein